MRNFAAEYNHIAMNRQKHSAFKAIALACMLVFTAVTSHATVVDWSCDRNNGTYCIIDLNGELANLAPNGNPYMITTPQNIVSGQEIMTAHLQARCVGNAVNSYLFKAVAKGPAGYQEDSAIVVTNSNRYNADSLFNVYDGCDRIEFFYIANGNTKMKYFKMWIPMPVHLDARDQVLPDSVGLGSSRDYFISINTFLTWDDQRDITITPLNDTTTNYGDFTIVRNRINPSERCGRPARMTRFFVNTNDASNQFIVRFTPSATGARTARFVISNGRGNEDTITVTAQGCNPVAVKPLYKVTLLPCGAMGHAYCSGRRPVYHQGDTVTINAVPTPGCIFLGWSDGTRNAHYSFVITQDTMLMPYFAMADNLFHFTALQDSADIRFANLNMTSPVGLICSDDNGLTWTTFNVNSTRTLANRGDRLYVRADSFNIRFANILADRSIECYHFEADSTAVEGNILYLLDTYGMRHFMPDTAFAGLFKGSDIIYANNLILPLTVSRACYYGMFQGCTALRHAPELPARHLADFCYYDMFRGCSSLYAAPELPAPMLVNHCYSGMFRDCIRLSNMKVAFSYWNEQDSATFNWVGNVDTMGIFVAPLNLPQIVDSTHIPYNWLAAPIMLTYRSQNYMMGHVIALDAATGALIRSGDLVPRGTDVIMKAIPTPGFQFIHWVSVGGPIIPNMAATDTIRINKATCLIAVFRHIIPHPHHIMEYSDDTETIADIDVYTNGTSIMISGIDQATVNIYDAAGRLVKTTLNSGEPIEVSIPGVYFVQVDNRPAISVVVE